MVSIETKFIGPTNNHGSRYKAWVPEDIGHDKTPRSITLESDHTLGSEQNHYRVARALIAKLGWFHDGSRGDTYGKWYGGGTRTGYVFVCALDYAELKAE